MNRFEEALDRAIEVAYKKFPQTDARDFSLKLLEESGELDKALYDKRKDLALEELADCFICLAGVVDRLGLSFHKVADAIEFKNTKNMLRTFVRQPNGTYKHVEGK